MEVVRLANGDLPLAKRMLLAKLIAQFRKEEDLVAVLSVLRDDRSSVQYELVRSIRECILGAPPEWNGEQRVHDRAARVQCGPETLV